ncbi:MAG: hypothetical protein U5K76_12135 [Woeseiaceae bacterium]|nr:hypothetical protein [Woeseiaceae bacterium]
MRLCAGASALVKPPGFFLGSMVRVIRPRHDWVPKGMESKVEVGCKFVQTQPLLDVDRLRERHGAPCGSR